MKRTRILLASMFANVVFVSILLALAADGGNSNTPPADASDTVAPQPTGARTATASPASQATGPAAPNAGDNRYSRSLEGNGTVSGSAVMYTFDGAPAQPSGALRVTGWDIQAHSRDAETWLAMEPMAAQHGPACEAPGATHDVTNWEDTVFQCNNHIMTSLNASDYGVIYLTPGALLDFSERAGTVEWSMSTQRQSVRDWPDLWLSAWEDNLALPLDRSLPDLQGPPRRAIHVSFNTAESSPVLTVVRDGNEQDYNAGWETEPMQSGIRDGTNQAATRQTFRLTVTPTRVTLERLESATAPSLVFWSFDIPDLGFRQAVVQLGHHSYTPTKDDAGEPGTWHWDNVRVEPAMPFSITPADQRFVDGDGGEVTFASPAGDQSWLRFAAIGRVTVNGTPVDPVVPSEHPEHMNSYFVPVPAGTASVSIGLDVDGFYEGPFRANGFAIWSRAAD